MLPPLTRQQLGPALNSISPCVHRGRVLRVTGTIVQAGLSGAAVGDMVEIARAGLPLSAQVVGFNRDEVTLSPFGAVEGILPGAAVWRTGGPPALSAGKHLLGSVIDAAGRVLRSFQQATGVTDYERLSVAGCPPRPLERMPVTRSFVTGLRIIDGLLTLGEGQRVAVFAEPGVGKSSLLRTIARGAAADITVIALVGERGREIAEWADEILAGPGGARSVIVAAASSDPPLSRALAAATATRIAEHFRDRGKQVLLLLDSLTRLFRAYREVGLAAGELPVRRGYPPSVFARLPELIERAGASAHGSITALYTVLLSSDLDEDPMVEEVKGLTDGHLMLSRELAEEGRYPAVALPASLSRLAGGLVPAEVAAAAGAVRAALKLVGEENEILALRDGEQRLPQPLEQFHSSFRSFCMQGSREHTDLATTFRGILAVGELARCALQAEVKQQ